MARAAELVATAKRELAAGEKAEQKADAHKWAAAEALWKLNKEEGWSKKALAREIGRHERTVFDYIAVWDKAGYMRPHPGFFETLMQVRGQTAEQTRDIVARRALRERPAEVIAAMPAEEKARVVQQIAKDSPEAIRDAAADLETRVAFTQGTAAHHKEADKETETKDRGRHGFQKDTALNAEVALFNADGHVRSALGELSQIEPDAEAKVALLRVANRIRERLDILITFLEEGGSIDDAALAELLEG